MADRRADHADPADARPDLDVGGPPRGDPPGRPATLPPALVPREKVADELADFYASAVRSAPGTLHHLVITMGAGKTDELKEVMRSSSERFVVCVPTHALGAEYERDLEGTPGGVFVRRGITAHGTAGDLTCRQFVRVSRVIRAGADPLMRVCPSCPQLKNHPAASGGPCPAYVAARVPEVDARIRILQSTRADAVLEGLLGIPGGDDDDDNDGEPDADDAADSTLGTALPIVVFDEPPPNVLTVTLTSGTAMSCRSYLARLRESARDGLVGILSPVLDALANHTLSSSDSLADILARAGMDESGLKDALKTAWSTRPQLTSASEKEMAVVTRSTTDLADDAHALTVISVLREAAFEPKRALYFKDEKGTEFFSARAPWVRQLRSYLLAGGRAMILDATGDPRDLRSLGISPDHKKTPIATNTKVVHVADAPGIERRWVEWRSGARSRHVVNSTVQVKNIRGPLRTIAKLAASRPGLLGIIAFKEVAALLRREIDRRTKDCAYRSDLLPDEFAALVDAKKSMLVGHYGAHRGMNSWKEATTMVTLGDPFPDLAVVRAEAQTLRSTSGSSDGVSARGRTESGIGSRAPDLGRAEAHRPRRQVGAEHQVGAAVGDDEDPQAPRRPDP